MIKNNFRILKKQYAYLQTIIKAPVKFEKDWPKTVGGVACRRYILPIHFCSIRARKKSVKNAKHVIKNNIRILKKQYAYLQTILKAPVKFEKDWLKTVGGVAGRRYILPMHSVVLGLEKSQLKCKKCDKNNFRILKNTICISSDHPKSACKV